MIFANTRIHICFLERSFLMILICGIIMFTGIISTISLCKAAGRADRWIEEIREEQDK